MSKHSFFRVFFCIFAHDINMVQKGEIFEFPQVKGIVVSGDIHGDITPLVYKFCVQYGMTDTLIIVAGDCGFGFESPGYYEDIYKRCREKLSKANNWLVFIRGNHDNPAYFNSLPIKHQRWMTLPDYSTGRSLMILIIDAQLIPSSPIPRHRSANYRRIISLKTGQSKMKNCWMISNMNDR